MDRTAELRWFLPEVPPPPVVSWFDRAAGPPRDRADVYLVLPGTDALGVKLRGGTTRLDLKFRRRPAAELVLPGGVSGQLEEWERWSLVRPAISRLLPRLGLPKGRWLAVAKRRRLITMPLGDEAGCQVELTSLRVDDRRWSTLAFESFGPEPELVPALEAAAKELFGSLDLPGGLGAACSCGYPGWLAML